MQPMSNYLSTQKTRDLLSRPAPSPRNFLVAALGDQVLHSNDSLVQQQEETIRQQTQEIQKLTQANLKKDLQLEKVQIKLKDMQVENTNYHDEIIDQTKVLSEKFVQLKNEQKTIKQLQETIKTLNESTATPKVSLVNELEQVQIQKTQKDQLCTLLLQEIDQLDLVKKEQGMLIKELQKEAAHNEKTEKAFVDVFSKEEVGTPEESENSDMDRLELEVEEKNLQIQQLYEQLQAAQGVYDKIKFLEDKNQNLRDKLAATQVDTVSKSFWDLDIRCKNASLLSLYSRLLIDQVNDKWQFEIKNPDGLGDYQQQISVFGFDSQVLQEFIDVTFNYSKLADGIFNTMTTQAITHLKAITPPFLLFQSSKVSKKQMNQTFLLSSKLLSRQHYSKGSVKQVDKYSDDQSAQEEFWFQFCFNQTGTVIFVCHALGLEEVELIKRITFLQLTYEQQRLIVIVIRSNEITAKELNTCNLMCQELQIVQGTLDQEESITSQRVLLNIDFKKQTHSELQLYLQAVIKSDQAQLKQSFSFVDQIREYIVQTYTQYFECPEDVQPDFKIEQPNDDVEGFELTLVLQADQKPKLKRNRLTNIITSQSVVNTKYEDNGEVHIELFAPAGEIIKKHKVKPYHIRGQGTKLLITLYTDFGSGQDDIIQKYRYIQMIPQWFIKTREVQNLSYKLIIFLEQDLSEQQNE